jgi:hypothetical protein
MPMKSTDPVELPEDLRQEVMQVAMRTGLSVAWLVGLYRRGFAAKMGATGRYPYGKMSDADEGELAVALATDVRNGVVRMEFGKPVAWLALPAAHARQFAQMLLAKADELDRKLS